MGAVLVLREMRRPRPVRRPDRDDVTEPVYRDAAAAAQLTSRSARDAAFRWRFRLRDALGHARSVVGPPSYASAVPYPTTYPAEATDQDAVDLAGHPCPRLTGPRDVARRLAELDERYIRTAFVPLDELASRRHQAVDAVRADIAAGRLPQPAYRLDDGTDMVPPDYFALVDAAGLVDALPRWFSDRYRAAARKLNLPADELAAEEQWQDYISGGYLVCLNHATPETIAEKVLHITVIDALLSHPQPDNVDWTRRLRGAVDGLAAIERTGAILDPPRWGGPMSPQWYGTYLRTRYPHAFAELPNAGHT